MSFNNYKFIFPSGDRICLLIIALLVLVSFHSAIGADFLMIDDDLNIYKNPHFQKISLNSFLIFWQGSYENLYIPVTYNLWAILCIISKAAYGKIVPQIFHLVNILVHMINSIMVFALVRLIISNRASIISDNRSPTLFASLVFAIHPITVESVAWISGMKDLLFTFFALLSIILFIKNVLAEKERRSKSALAFLFFILAFLSKPTAIITPFFIGVLLILFLDKPLKALTPLITWTILSLIIAVISKTNMPPPPPENYLPLFQRLFIASYTFLFYIKKIMWPSILLYDYGEKPETVIGSAFTYVLPFLLVFILSLTCKYKKRKLAGGILLFALSILPYSGLVPFEFQRFSIVADRYSYFGVLAIAVCIVFLLAKIRHLKLFLPVFLTIVCALVIKTYFQTQIWQNDTTLCLHTIKYNIKSDGAYTNLGIKQASEGLFDEAVNSYQKALKINPDSMLANYNLGIAYACTKKFDAAESQLLILKKTNAYHAEKLQKAIEYIKANL